MQCDLDIDNFLFTVLEVLGTARQALPVQGHLAVLVLPTPCVHLVDPLSSLHLPTPLLLPLLRPQ